MMWIRERKISEDQRDVMIAIVAVAVLMLLWLWQFFLSSSRYTDQHT
jgi:hypothetical protein